MSSGLNFIPDIQTFLEDRKGSKLTVISGNNNSGKSAILKSIKKILGTNSYLVAPSRFYHVHLISSQQKDPSELENLNSQFQNSFFQPEYNSEQNFLDLNRVIVNLNDKERKILFSICGELIGSKFELKKVDPENVLSMWYIDIDGQSLGQASTGTRLLMTLLGICMDKRFNTILIDEPELGFSPKIQNALASFLQDGVQRLKYFPHLLHVYIATHSHLFLDRTEPKNNFVVSRNGSDVKISRIETVGELHWLQFNLLGNSLEKISLPSAILVTEGPSDYEYLKRVIEIKFPEKRITIISGYGDVKKKVNSIREILGGDLQKSPYKNRIFVVVDSVHPQALSKELCNMGLENANLVVWSKNGIEYLYPVRVLSEIYSLPEKNVLNEITINDDDVSVRKLIYKKTKLSEMVVSKLGRDTIFPEELVTKLIESISLAIN